MGAGLHRTRRKGFPTQFLRQRTSTCLLSGLAFSWSLLPDHGVLEYCPIIWMDAYGALFFLKRFVSSFNSVLTYVSPLCVCLSTSPLAFINDCALLFHLVLSSARCQGRRLCYCTSLFFFFFPFVFLLIVPPS